MSKAWHATKEGKKPPAMTFKQRRALKQMKKHPHENPPIIVPH